MGAVAGASNGLGCGFPDGIVIVFFADEGVGNFVQQGVADRFVGSGECQVDGDGDPAVAVVAASGASGAVVECKGPAAESVFG